MHTRIPRNIAVVDCHYPNSADALSEPEERFIAVLRYYLSGWHIKPKGVKKPCVLTCMRVTKHH